MKTILRSQEFSCPSCVKKIETALKQVDGVTSAQVHFATGRIEIEHDPRKAAPGQLVEAVRAAGYEARPSAF